MGVTIKIRCGAKKKKITAISGHKRWENQTVQSGTRKKLGE